MIAQKATILCLYEILKKYTDENHILSADKIREKLKIIYDVDMERRAIYRNIEALRSMGIEIEGYQENREGYYLMDREFELSEIRMLCDAVAASDMIKEETGKIIIKKLIDSQSIFQGRMLQKTVYVKSDKKIINKYLFYNIDALNVAINQGCKVRVQLLEYGVDGELVEVPQGNIVLSPYVTIWVEGNYYILAKRENAEQLEHFRIDHMEYFTLLNKVREGKVCDADIDILNSRVLQDASVYDRYTTLLPTKAEAEALNQYHIDQLDSEEYVYHAKIEFDKYPNSNRNLEAVFPISNTLRLKKGALVMMVANDSEHRWVNGTLGIVNQLAEDYISVAINKRIHKLSPHAFTEQEIRYENGKLIYEDVRRVSQYPVVLAYAITIHKSQGQTYQNIICDIDRCFANGQAYVALSRCASMKGLHLKQRVSKTSIRVDKRVTEFYENQLMKANNVSGACERL